MKSSLFAFTVGLVLMGCAGKKEVKTTDALKELQQRYANRVGVASKTELVEEFGTADWCEPKNGGGETCRFYKSLGVKWKGDAENRTKYQAFDEVVAEFDSQGILREYKARAQR